MAGRRAIETADSLFAEFYTSRLAGTAIEAIDGVVGRPVQILRRPDVEGESKALIEAARRGTAVLLCAGDPMTATTHNELRFRVEKLGIPISIVHGVSIQSAAAGAVGLHSYKFGRTTTLARAKGTWLPESPLEVIEENLGRGLHTLVLLDPGDEMENDLGIAEAARLLQSMGQKRAKPALDATARAVGVARLGSTDALIRSGTVGELSKADFGGPPQSLIVTGRLHFTEEEALAHWRG